MVEFGEGVDAFGEAVVVDVERAAEYVVDREVVDKIVSNPNGGYYLYTAFGNVYNTSDATWYGSPANNGVSNVVGMAMTADGKGYRDRRRVDFPVVRRAYGPLPVLALTGD